MFALRLRTRSKIELAVIAVLVAALVVVLLARKPDRANASTLVAVTCGQVITASITVTNDLTNCPGDGLVVGHDSITITLTGHKIDGIGGVGYGVHINGHKSVIVTGGTIQDFIRGVNINGATNTVKNARLTGNIFGVYVDSGVTGNTITLNNVYSNSYGAFVFGPSTKITSNTFANNTNIGLNLGSTALSSVITGNHALNNTSTGIYNSASMVTLTSNVANGNSADGIYSSTALATFTTNTANYNTQLGIAAQPGSTDGNGNKAHDNGTAKQCVNVVCS